MRLSRTFRPAGLAVLSLLGACAHNEPRQTPLIYTDDPYSKTIEINGTGELDPLGGDQQLDWRLFSSVDRKTGAVAHELFIHSVADGPRFTYTNAADDTATPMEFRLDHRVNIVCRYRLVCGEEDELTVPLGADYLHAKAASGFGVKIWSNDGYALVAKVTPAMIAEQLAAVQKAETSLGRTAPPAEAAPRPAAAAIDPNTPAAPLGVDYIPVNAMMLHQMMITEDYGMALIHVTDGSPAARAGLYVGDVLTKFGKTPLKVQADLQDAVKRVPPHGKVTIEYWRGRQRFTTTAQF